MTKLLEADFITTDINSLINGTKTKSNSTVQNNSPSAVNQATETQLNSVNNIKDWAAELKNRTSQKNNGKTTYDIELDFFKDFFNSKWSNVADQLMLIGDQLRKDIKVLGFTKKTNPIIAFISLSFVQKSLLQTKLLNINTYKVIHNAIANNWIADSEFFTANDYNIIYCTDLYKKSLNDMQIYLKLQAKILDPKASVYTIDDQLSNKRTFLSINKNKETDINRRIKNQLSTDMKSFSVKKVNTILNDLDFVRAIMQKKFKNDNLDSEEILKDDASIEDFVNLFEGDPAKIMAFIQYFVIKTGNATAKKALSSETFKNIPLNNLMSASAQISEWLPKVKPPVNDINTLIKALLRSIR